MQQSGSRGLLLVWLTVSVGLLLVLLIWPVVKLMSYPSAGCSSSLRAVVCAVDSNHCDFHHTAVGDLRAIADGIFALAQAKEFEEAPRSLDEFLAPVPATPAEPCCSKLGNRCQNDPSVWEHPTWRALWFAPKHTWCRYSIEHSTVNPGSELVVSAICDCNRACNGKTIEFKAAVRPFVSPPELVIYAEHNLPVGLE